MISSLEYYLLSIKFNRGSHKKKVLQRDYFLEKIKKGFIEGLNWQLIK